MGDPGSLFTQGGRSTLSVYLPASTFNSFHLSLDIWYLKNIRFLLKNQHVVY